MMPAYYEIAYSADCLTDACHLASKRAGWWDGVDPREPYVTATKLMLAVSELAEAMEGARKGLKDDKLPDCEMLEVELADCVIRVFDLAGALGFRNFGGTLAAKMAYNATRVDHKKEHRDGENGKRF
jgi:NTP pyrophosphatase (non-canonical NTP hydrolase)